MQYRHAPAGDHTDLVPGGVLFSAPGHPAFPVRLGLEILGRCLEHLRGPGHSCDSPPGATSEPAPGSSPGSSPGAGPDGVTLWDPCCGSGALVTALGLAQRRQLRAVLASDVDPEPLILARRNLALLSADGLTARGRELRERHQSYGKQSHRRAVGAAAELAASLTRDGGELPHEVATLDALDPAATATFARRHRPDVVLTDAPYGRQTRWSTAPAGPADLVASLAAALEPHAVLAVVSNDRRVPLPDGSRALERLRVGHRAGVIVRAADVATRHPAGRDPRPAGC